MQPARMMHTGARACMLADVQSGDTDLIAAILPIIRPINESTISRAEMSISTPARTCQRSGPSGHLGCDRQAVVHIDLDRHQQEITHLEDRDPLHRAIASGPLGMSQ